MSGRRLGPAAAVAVIVLANAAVLTGVAWNRNGMDARVELTERECALQTVRDRDEETGLALLLNWRPLSEGPAGGPPLFDRETLGALGFDVSLPPGYPEAPRFYARALPREAFLVLSTEKMKGATAWRSAADPESGNESRLFAVAAGRDAEALRQRYPDRTHYLILPARVHLRLVSLGTLGGIAELLNDQIHVPPSLRSVFDRLPPEPEVQAEKRPRYRVTIATGKRHELWLESAERLSL
jgi:hypothetical protein